MAKRNCPPIAVPVQPLKAPLPDRERLRVKDWCWRSLTHDIYSGNALELTAAGLVRPEQLPGAQGMPSTAVTFYDGQLMTRHQRCKHDAKHLNIVRSNSRFTVYIGVTADVAAEREAVYERELKARQEARDAERAEQQAVAAAEYAYRERMSCARVTLEVMPKSPQEYRQKLLEDLNGYARSVRSRMQPSKGSGLEFSSMGVAGFTLDDSDVSEFDDLISEVKEFLSHVGVRFNAQRQNEIISNCKGVAAKADTKFQRVLAACAA